jgi:ABC-type transporter Mla subunit MlaD
LNDLKKFCNDVLGVKLNTLLDTVYEMNDASEGVSDDLEKLISSTVQQVEEMVDALEEALK